MHKVRWGILGCASFARRRSIPAMLASPSVDLVGIASRSLEKAETFRQMFNLPRAYGSYEDLLADENIQAVYIPLPNGLHGEWMIKAAEKGKHCLCEKPFTSDAAEAERVAAVASEHSVQVMEGFMWRLHPQHLRARAVIRDGAIGRVQLVRSAFSFLMERQPNVRFVPALAGGCVLDVGCYPISAARFYFEDEPYRAFARGEMDPEFGVDMRVGALLEFRGGRALIDCAFNLPYRGELEVVGEKGTIFLPKSWQPDPESVIVINGKPEKLPAENHYVKQFEHFSQCVANGTRPEYGVEDSIRQMRVIDSVLRSMRSGFPETV
jgi:xylose dehydrogenase (NAD/NADP)